jgi:succinyldiaminopimelate transaminase
MTAVLKPALAAMPTYPFTEIEAEKRRLVEGGVELLDFGIGDPQEPTEPFIRRALIEAVGETSGYPKAEGLPELRAAIAAWIERRFGVRVDPASEVVPTLGSKEAIFGLASLVVDVAGGRDVVVTTTPGYPVPERGGLTANASVLALPLRAENGFLPDLDEVPRELWDRIAIFWLNYPNNPTTAVAPLAFYEELAGRAERHGFLLASDEAYSEVYFDRPPPSALQVRNRRNVVVFNTLSKRSSMTGYRAGFVAADPEVMAALKKARPMMGVAPQEFVQRAAIAAWGDEEHVARMRERYRAKREVFLDLFARCGLRIAGSAATLYLWVQVPDGETSTSFARALLGHGVVVGPGPYFGEAGEGYVRFALVPPLEACHRAVEVLETALAPWSR